MVTKRKRVRGLVSTPAHPKVSLSRPTITERDEELIYLCLLIQCYLTPLRPITNLPLINVIL